MGLYRIPEELLDESIHDVINTNAVSGTVSTSPKRGIRHIFTTPHYWKMSGKGNYNKDSRMPTFAIKREVQNALNGKSGSEWSKYADGRVPPLPKIK